MQCCRFQSRIFPAGCDRSGEGGGDAVSNEQAFEATIVRLALAFSLVFFLCFLQNIALAVVMDEQVRERERSLSAENVLPF